MDIDKGSTIREQALHPEQSARPEPKAPAQVDAKEPLDERVHLALIAAADKKALDPVLLDLRSVASFTDFFVITSGANIRQVQAISDAIVDGLKAEGSRPARVEGYSTAEWVLVDYGDFIVHIFEDKARKFYDLERLWREATRIPLSTELTGKPALPATGNAE